VGVAIYCILIQYEVFYSLSGKIKYLSFLSSYFHIDVFVVFSLFLVSIPSDNFHLCNIKHLIDIDVYISIQIIF